MIPEPTGNGAASPNAPASPEDAASPDGAFAADLARGEALHRVTDPWELLHAMRAMGEKDRPEYVEDYTRLAAKRPPLERDALLHAGRGVFNYSLATAREDVKHKMAEAKAAPAPPNAAEVEAERERRRAELEEQARDVLAAADPLTLVDAALRRAGYGGDLAPARIVYLAATSRLLEMRHGNMPVHLLLIGIPGSGKSYTLQTVRALLPSEAHHTVDAGSPRVLIYDTESLRHRVLIFSEADSLPEGEDNPAASALRTLLQDHVLTYQVVVKDGETGEYVVQTVSRPGPTTLITTAVKRLGPQLDSRVFVLEVPEDKQRVKQALATRALIERRGGVDPPDAALMAFQSLLQIMSPWKVSVPFADSIARAVGESSAGPRILRDFERLLSLIKSVALLRHQHRRQDENGRWVATIEDYRTVYGLVNEMYVGSTGVSREIRAVVKAVEDLLKERQAAPTQQRPGGATAYETLLERQLGVTGADVARRLEIYPMAASRRIRAALDGGWLVNHSEGKRQALTLGGPLPEVDGLPAPERLTPPRRTPFPFESGVTSLVDQSGAPSNVANGHGYTASVTSNSSETQRDEHK
jgi:hypothetical protein